MIAILAGLHFYGNSSAKLKIVGVTGTNGKTTIATLLYKVATALGYKCGLIGTVENMIAGEKIKATHTTPDPISLHKLLNEMAEKGCTYVFMEVSSHALDQSRVAGIKFAGGIFTNLTHDHLDYHKNFDNYFEAKKRFFKMLPANAFALANIDDEYGLKMMEGIKARKFSYGFKNKANFNEKLETKLLGGFNEYNALAVYATTVLLGLDKEKAKEILKNVAPPRGRFEHFTSSSGVLVIVDYAHTPDALEKILLAIREIKKASPVGLPSGIATRASQPRENSKIISVFGCGGDRDPMKRSVMGRIGAKLSDIAIFTSDNSRSEDPEKIISEMKTNLLAEESKKVKAISNRHEAILEAVKLAQAGDIILCAGKGHEDYQEIMGVKHHFDDVEELKKAFH
jgi:UDP-N-acetylmuramoyl-L-alanyl-D-glutamate--2,6-diaminopimelate ligase